MTDPNKPIELTITLTMKQVMLIQQALGCYRNKAAGDMARVKTSAEKFSNQKVIDQIKEIESVLHQVQYDELKRLGKIPNQWK